MDKPRLLFALVFLSPVEFSRAQHWDAAEKDRAFGKAITSVRCVLRDFGCNQAISGINPSVPEENAASLFEYFLREGRIRHQGGIDPNHPYAGAIHYGGGKDSLIFLPEKYYEYNPLEKVLVLLHELGHATSAGASHHGDDETAYYEIIRGHCSDPVWIRRCY